MAMSKGISSSQVLGITKCVICTESFKEPKVLPCIHTFCLHCLEKYGENDDPGDKVKCPLCKKEFIIPPGGFKDLPNNYFIVKLTQLTDQLNRYIECELCSALEEQPATMYCVECEQYLCQPCSTRHSRQKNAKWHTVVSLEDSPSAEQLRKMAPSYCEKHSNKEIEFYCYDCKMISCVTCYVESHNKHKCSDVKKAGEELRGTLMNNIEKVAPCIVKTGDLKKQIEEMKKTLIDKVTAAKQEIANKYNELTSLLDSHRDTLNSDLNLFKATILKQLEKKEEEAERQSVILESYRGYCEELKDKGTSCDVSRAANDLQTRAEELLKNQDVLMESAGLSSVNISFIPSATAIDNINNWIGQLSFSGLDPAGPAFEENPDKTIGLNPTSASLVDVIHTSWDLGNTRDLSHIDFYPSGGQNQPGCIVDKQRKDHEKPQNLFKDDPQQHEEKEYNYSKVNTTELQRLLTWLDGEAWALQYYDGDDAFNIAVDQAQREKAKKKIEEHGFGAIDYLPIKFVTPRYIDLKHTMNTEASTIAYPPCPLHLEKRLLRPNKKIMCNGSTALFSGAVQSTPHSKKLGLCPGHLFHNVSREEWDVSIPCPRYGCPGHKIAQGLAIFDESSLRVQNEITGHTEEDELFEDLAVLSLNDQKCLAENRISINQREYGLNLSREHITKGTKIFFIDQDGMKKSGTVYNACYTDKLCQPRLYGTLAITCEQGLSHLQRVGDSGALVIRELLPEEESDSYLPVLGVVLYIATPRPASFTIANRLSYVLDRRYGEGRMEFSDDISAATNLSIGKASSFLHPASLRIRVLSGKWRLAEKGEVWGVAVINRKLFVARDKVSHVEVYDANNLTITPSLLKIVAGKQLRLPRLAACAHCNCLYVRNYISNRESIIYRVELSNSSVTQWTVKEYCTGLSVAKNNSLLMTVSAHPRLQVYTTHGNLIREISLDSSIDNPQHCVQLSTDNFVISHTGSVHHRICIVDAHGQILKSYGQSRGSGLSQLNDPYGISVDSHDNVFVADSRNGRVQLLSPSLTLLGSVQTQGHKLNWPIAVHFDEDNGHLYIDGGSGNLLIAE